MEKLDQIKKFVTMFSDFFTAMDEDTFLSTMGTLGDIYMCAHKGFKSWEAWAKLSEVSKNIYDAYGYIYPDNSIS